MQPKGTKAGGGVCLTSPTVWETRDFHLSINSKAWRPNINPNMSTCPEISPGAFLHQKTAHEFWRPSLAVARIPLPAIVLVSPAGDGPHSTSPGSICRWTKPFSSEGKKGCACGAADHHKTLRFPTDLCQAGRQSSSRGETSSVPDPPSWVYCRVREPRPAGHLDLQASRLQLRVLRPETRRDPAACPSLPRRPPFPPRPPSSARRQSPPPSRLPSSNPGGLHPPASPLAASFISPSLVSRHLHQPLFLRPQTRPPPPSLSSSKPGLHLRLLPDLGPHPASPSPQLFPSLLIPWPRLRLSASQLLSGSNSAPHPRPGASMSLARQDQCCGQGSLAGLKRKDPTPRPLWARQRQAAFVVQAGASSGPQAFALLAGGWTGPPGPVPARRRDGQRVYGWGLGIASS